MRSPQTPSNPAGSAPVPPGRRLDLRSLVRLRWGAAGLALFGIGGATYALGLALPLAPLLAIVAALVVTNAWLARRVAADHAATSEALVGGVALLDVVLLTELLALSGGPMNPFSVFYLVYVALGALLLRARWAWSLVAASALLFAALFARAPDAHLHGSTLDLHLYGMWAAYTLAATLLAAFVGRAAAALRHRELELREAQERIARTDRLAALTTLAAGAAHELGTPLGTIALAARELEDALAERVATRALAGDARLIRNEVRRCRGILEQMSADAGELAGEGFVPVAVGDLLDDVVGHLAEPRRERVRLAVADGVAGDRLRVPPRAFSRVLENLIENGLRASAEGGHVDVVVDRVDHAWRFVVRDHGVGMAPDVLERAGEPFFTTREPGEGLGLGLFLARTFVDRLGGSLALASAPGRGTTATVELPA